MRLSLFASALVPMLCLSGSCFGGPTSDWPRGAHGGDNGEDTPPAEMPSGGGKDSNAPPPVVRDAGKPSNGGSGTSISDGGSSAHFDGGVLAPMGSDSGLPDGGVAPPGDGGVPVTGAGTGCTENSDARDAGGCFGVYCSTTRAQLAQSVSATGSCLAPEDVALACDGALTRVVSACAQDDALTLGLGMTVDDCARMDPSIADASDACIDCYVAETVCSVQNCLAPCLAGMAAECTSCRVAHCGAAFETCSGLPRP